MAGIKGKVKTDGLKKLQSALNKMNEEQRAKWHEAAVKELADRLLAKVIMRTPTGKYPKETGKKGGTLKRGWTVGAVKRNGNEFSIEIINLVKYAPYVEFGHRTRNHQGWVNGRFMLTISEQELETDAPRILENKMKNYLGGAFM